MFAGLIYCTLFLLDCFDFAYGCICIRVYSLKTFIAVINLCLYVGLLQFWSVFLCFPFFFLLPFFFFYLFIILIYNLYKSIMFFLHLILCLPFLLFFSPCSSSLMYIDLLHLPLLNWACLFFLFFFLSFLSFPFNIFVSFVFIALFPTWHLASVLFSNLCFS